MSTVYEIAACSWRDSLTLRQERITKASDKCNSDGSANDLNIEWSTSLLTMPSYLNHVLLKDLPMECIVTVKSMLLRAKYGGMMCDVTMLHEYAELWTRRF